MTMLEKTVDVVVVGGGAAGMMAALAACARGRSVTLLEGGDRLGRKILISGNGRCNFTNVDADAPRHYYGGGGGFVRPALKRFSVPDTVGFFRRLGVEPREHTRGRLFPMSDQARSVAAVLKDRLAVSGVVARTGARVQRIERRADGFDVHTPAGSWRCGKVVMATGGPSAPRLGADRSGIDLVCALGHRCTELLPGLVPLISPDPCVRRMHGARVHALVSASVGGGVQAKDCGDVLFTSYGVSGLAILSISARLVPLLGQGKRDLTVDFFPGRSAEELAEMLKARWAANPHRSLTDSFLGLMPDNVTAPLMESLGLPRDRTVNLLSKHQRWHLAQGLHAWKISVTAPRPLEYAEVTIGGIHTAEVDPDTLASHVIPGMFLAGEMLDVHGDLGGYNLQWAWSSGWLAGHSAGA